MTPKQARLSFFLLCAVALYASGIIPAIIPAAVPTANKIGNSAKFQLGATGAVAGDCPAFDANLNLTGPGTGAGCGSSSSAGGGIVVYSGTAGVSLSGTAYFPVGGGSAANATETTVDADISASTTVSRFGANISVALGVGNSVAFTFRKNAADQTLTCTISGASATSCADTVHSFAVTPGDLIAIKAVFSGTIVVTPVFVLTAQTGSLAQGQVNTGTQFQLGQYATAGATLSGVTVPNCADSSGQHLNFNSSTGQISCGTSATTPSSMYWNGMYITGGSFPSAIVSNAGTGDVDIYTCPIGKRCFVTGASCFNSSVSTITALYTEVKISGTYYRLSANSAPGTLTRANFVQQIVLEPGDSISVNASGSGCNLTAQVFQYDSTVAFYSPRLTSFINGNNTFYTAPNGKTVYNIGGNTQTLGVSPSLIYSNESGNTATTKWYVVPSGQSIGAAYQVDARSSNTNVVLGVGSLYNLSAGDLIAVNTDQTGKQLLYTIVVEF